jgi:predicted acylesterase/phospholipase RssA
MLPTPAPIPVSSLPVWFPRVLVIGPGGIKGLKALGFLAPVEDSHLLDNVDTYGGVSIGAVISLLLICGYQAREIVREAVTFDIFKEIGSFDFRNIMENKGFLSSEPVRRRLTQLVINKFGNVPTLHGLYMMTGKAFIAVTLNATDEICMMMNPFDNPDVSCVDAAMFSMNIPFIFYQLIHRGKILVDGALANPYPVDYFDDGRTNILGIYMKTASVRSDPVPHPPGVIVQRLDDPSGSVPLASYPLKIIHSLMDHRRNHIIQNTSAYCKHVCLEVTIGHGVDTLGLESSMDDKAKMLVEGFNEGKAFLAQLQAGTYVGPKIPEKLQYNYPPYFMMGENEAPQTDPPVVLDEMQS